MPSEPPEHSFEQSQHQQILILVPVSERAKGHLVSGKQLKKKLRLWSPSASNDGSSLQILPLCDT